MAISRGRRQEIGNSFCSRSQIDFFLIADGTWNCIVKKKRQSGDRLHLDHTGLFPPWELKMSRFIFFECVLKTGVGMWFQSRSDQRNWKMPDQFLIVLKKTASRLEKKKKFLENMPLAFVSTLRKSADCFLTFCLLFGFFENIGMDTKVEPSPDFLATKTAASAGRCLIEMSSSNQFFYT